MKITIELEIQPDEVGLASELLSTLRSLTDHVKVVTPNAPAVAPAASSHAPLASIAAAQQQPLNASHQAPLANGSVAIFQQPARTAIQHAPPQQQQPPAPPAPAPTPVVAPPQPQPAPAPPPPSAPRLTPPPAGTPVGVPQPFQNIVPRLADPATLDQATADIVASLRAANEHLEAALVDLTAVFERDVFENSAVIATSVMPYMFMYSKLPEDLRPKLRDKFVQLVLKNLTSKRPITADRHSFFAYADAFACLVKFGAVPMEGAVQTLTRMLNKPVNRAAGMTMLGKTVEYCGEQLLRTSDVYLADLWRAMESSASDNVFKYDIDYITDSLRKMVPPGAPAPPLPTSTAAPGAPPPGPLPTPGAAAATAPPPHTAALTTGGPPPAATSAPTAAAAAAPHPTPTSIVQVGNYVGHHSTVYTLSYDATHGQLFSGGQDGQLLVWGPDGSVASRLEVTNHSVCSLDVLPRSGTLLASAVPVDLSRPEGPAATADPSFVLGFNPPPPQAPGAPRTGPWAPCGRLYGRHRGLISVVKALGGDGEVFVVGEHSYPQGQGQDAISLYDISRGGPLEQLAPLTVYSGHGDMVTCAAPCHVNPSLFVTGGSSILVWDRRVGGGSVGAFGEVDAAGRLQTSAGQMINSLDVTDHLLLSTSSAVEGYLSIWDFRQLGSTHGSAVGPVVKLQIDAQPTYKVAVTGAPHSRLAAVSTLQGLYVVDFTNFTAPTTLVVHDNRVQKVYHDLRWAGGPSGPVHPMLFAIGSVEPTIDVFGLSFGGAA